MKANYALFRFIFETSNKKSRLKGPKDPSSGKPKNKLSTLKLGSLLLFKLNLIPVFPHISEFYNGNFILPLF